VRIVRPMSRLMSAAALLCAAATAGAQTKPAPGNAAARGQYLVSIMSCNDCHTPFKMGAKGPEPDMTRMLSGFPETSKLPPPPAPAGPWIWSGTGDNTAFAGPWGITYAANLTPDKNTGLGIWTEDMFVKALKTGKHMGTSREIQPPMPWPWIGKATDDDLKAIYAYLRSIPPLSNHVPDWAPPKTAAGSAAAPAAGASPKKK
jgi:hypothetical protein